MGTIGGVEPVPHPLADPWITENGVRSSWARSASRFRRRSLLGSRRWVIALKERASRRTVAGPRSAKRGVVARRDAVGGLHDVLHRTGDAAKPRAATTNPQPAGPGVRTPARPGARGAGRATNACQKARRPPGHWRPPSEGTALPTLGRAGEGTGAASSGHRPPPGGGNGSPSGHHGGRNPPFQPGAAPAPPPEGRTPSRRAAGAPVRHRRTGSPRRARSAGSGGGRRRARSCCRMFFTCASIARS